MYDIGVWSVVPKYRPDSVTKDGADVGVFNVPATVMQGQSGKVPQVGYAFWSVVPQPSKMERLLQSDSAVVPSNDPVRMVTDRTCKRSRGTFCLK